MLSASALTSVRIILDLMLTLLQKLFIICSPAPQVFSEDFSQTLFIIFSLFMNVSKPHPSDHPVLFLFVVGGVTCSEIQQINEFISSQNINTQVKGLVHDFTASITRAHHLPSITYRPSFTIAFLTARIARA